MDFLLNDMHLMIRETARKFSEEKIAPGTIERDENEVFPHEIVAELGKLGFMGMMVPEEWGGAGLDTVSYAIAVEEVSKVDASVGVIMSVNNSLVCYGINSSGSLDQKERYLRDLASGKKLGAFALSEPEAGSDAGGMRTKAVRDGDDWVINGGKRWITNAGGSTFYTVMAVTDAEKGTRGGITAFVLEKGDEGFTFGAPERKLGIHGSPTRELYFDGVRIPDSRRVGDVGAGFSIAMETLDHTRITIGAQAVGIAQGALDYAAAYAKERKQFGKAIAEFQGLQFMLADMAMKVEVARQMVYVAAAKSERGDDDLSFFGAAAKCFASDVAMEVTTNAVQVLGGYGYTRDYPVERMMRDAKITQIYEGTNQVQRIVMARQLVAGVQAEI